MKRHVSLWVTGVALGVGAVLFVASVPGREFANEEGHRRPLSLSEQASITGYADTCYHSSCYACANPCPTTSCVRTGTKWVTKFHWGAQKKCQGYYQGVEDCVDGSQFCGQAHIYATSQDCTQQIGYYDVQWVDGGFTCLETTCD